MNKVFETKLNLNSLVEQEKQKIKDDYIWIYEAISNSLYAINDRKNIFKKDENGNIDIDIYLEKEESLVDLKDKDYIFKKCIVKDDGIGFIESRIERYNTYLNDLSDNSFKGYGKITYFMFFDDISIESCFLDDKKLNYVNFKSNAKENKFILNYTEEKNSLEKYGTKITFDKPIKCKKFTNFNVNSFTDSLVEHFKVWFFNNKDIPNINLNFIFFEKNNKKTINLNQKFNDLLKKIKTYSREIKGYKFYFFVELKIAHKQNKFFLCANNRKVEEFKKLDKIKNISFKKNDTSYCLDIYILSKFFDENNDITRQKINIIDEVDQISFDENSTINTNDINDAILNVIEEIFPNMSSDTLNYVLNQLNNFINRNRKYYILKEHICDELKKNGMNSRFFKILYDFDPEKQDSFDKLDTSFYEFKREFLYEIKNTKTFDIDKEKDEINKKVNKALDINKLNLFELANSRKCVLDIYSNALSNAKKNSKDGTKEKDVHEIFLSKNKIKKSLWLLSDDLDYLTSYTNSEIRSDESFKKYENSKVQNEKNLNKRPDIYVNYLRKDNKYNIIDPHITLIEFKRPLRDALHLKKNNPIIQLSTYINEINLICDYEKAFYEVYSISSIDDKFVNYLERENFIRILKNNKFYKLDEINNNKKIIFWKVMSFECVLEEAINRNKKLIDSLNDDIKKSIIN